MIGFPKHLNTKVDYEFIKGNFPVEQWTSAFQDLLDERLQWFSVGQLATTDAGLTDTTHKVVELVQDGVTTRYQYELREDPNCSLFRLGFTVDEVTAILKEV